MEKSHLFLSNTCTRTYKTKSERRNVTNSHRSLSKMHSILRGCGCVLFFVTIVSSTVHHKYIYDRFNDFSDNDVKIVFPDQIEKEKSTLLLVNVVSNVFIFSDYTLLNFDESFL